jgi:hypothetical protein
VIKFQWGPLQHFRNKLKFFKIRKTYQWPPVFAHNAGRSYSFLCIWHHIPHTQIQSGITSSHSQDKKSKLSNFCSSYKECLGHKLENCLKPTQPNTSKP